MKEKGFQNRVSVNGYIFSITGSNEWNNLQETVTGENSKNPGQPYIRGVMNIATDDEGLNVVAVHFTYIVPTYKSGKENPNYTFLKRIVEEGKAGTLKTFELCGTEAEKVAVTGDLSLNEFVNQEGELIATKQIRGSFVGPMTARDSMGATFTLEALLSNASLHEQDNDDDYMTINGYAFNFRNEALPIQLTVHSAGGIKWFENKDISSKEPFFGTINGEIVSNIVTVAKDESDMDGFGEVKPTTRSVRAWDVISARMQEDWDFADNEDITLKEFKQLLSDRAEHEAQIKKDAEERAAKRDDGFSTPAKKAAKVEAEDDDDFVF